MTASKTSPSRLGVALRRSKAMQDRIDGVSVPDIRDRYGYKSTAAVYQDLSRAVAQFVGEPAAELKAIELARMDAQLRRLSEMEEKVREVRDREHLTVSHGKVITVPDPAFPDDPSKVIPLLDDEPVLRANAQLIAIEGKRGENAERRAKLLGLNAPTKVAVITDEALEDAIEDESTRIADLERALAAEEDEPEGAEEQEG